MAVARGKTGSCVSRSFVFKSRDETGCDSPLSLAQWPSVAALSLTPFCKTPTDIDVEADTSADGSRQSARISYQIPESRLARPR